MKEWIVRDEPGFFVVDKPAGVLSPKDKSGDSDLASLIQKALGKDALPFLAPVHRLDRNTSGLIILAKSSESARQLSEWLQEGKIVRTYMAIVKGDPGETGRYDFRLKKNPKTNEVSVSATGDEAITEFQRIQKLGNSSIVKARLITGKSHQIRVHFSHAGHALLGDKKYSKKPWSEIFGRPALHAMEIEIPTLAGRQLRISVRPPVDMQNLARKLGAKSL